MMMKLSPQLLTRRQLFILHYNIILYFVASEGKLGVAVTMTLKQYHIDKVESVASMQN